MGNFNINYDSTKVYSNSKDSGLKYKDRNILPMLDTFFLIVISNILVYLVNSGKWITSSTHTIID